MGRKKACDNYLNDITYIYYFNRLLNLAMSMFKWDGLPPEIDERFLEFTLLNQGRCVFFKDDVIGQYLALQTASCGPYNYYNIPTDRKAYAVNGYTNQDLNEENSVLIFNDMLFNGSVPEISMFAKRLFNLERTIDVNVNAQKTPIILQCSESQRSTIKTAYLEFEGNEPVIYGDKNLDLNSIRAIKTDAPFVSDQLQMLKSEIWNEAMTWLGISNVNTQKKERLITDEVSRNMGSVVSSRYTRLNMRQKARDQINMMFPELNISVEYREDFDTNVIETTKGGDNDGEIHDTSENDM